MDRRAKKLLKKRKKREVIQKRARAATARRPSEAELLIATAAGGRFGPCWVSNGWDDLHLPSLVTVVVTRRLPDGALLPGVALVDRTCLGVKSGFAAQPTRREDLAGFAARVGRAHGGMVECSALVAQSVVYHAIDFARTLGFEPDRDFPAALFGPRPEELLSTPWHAPESPLYISGPNDDVQAITARLEAAVGPGKFHVQNPFGLLDEGDEDGRFEGADDTLPAP